MEYALYFKDTFFILIDELLFLDIHSALPLPMGDLL